MCVMNTEQNKLERLPHDVQQNQFEEKIVHLVIDLV